MAVPTAPTAMTTSTSHGYPISEYPNGYYIIIGPENQPCVVYLYAHEDFNGVRHIAYGAQDGGAFLPVTDLRDDTVLIPLSLYESSPNAPDTTETLEHRFNNKAESAPPQVDPVDLGRIRYKDEVVFDDGSAEIVNEVGLRFDGAPYLRTIDGREYPLNGKHSCVNSGKTIVKINKHINTIEIDFTNLNLGDTVVYQDKSKSVDLGRIRYDAAWPYLVNGVRYSKYGIAEGHKHIIEIISKD